jgi:hypothetical protein
LNLEGIVLTMFDSRANLANQVVKDVRTYFAEVVYQTVIPRTIRLGEAPSYGKSIIEYDPNGRGAQAYIALGGEWLVRHKMMQPESPRQAEPVPAPEPTSAPAPEPAAEVVAEPAADVVPEQVPAHG